MDFRAPAANATPPSRGESPLPPLEIAEALGFPSDHTQMRDLRALLALRTGRFAEVTAHVMSRLNASFIAAGGAASLAQACEALEHPAPRDTTAAASALRRAAQQVPEPQLGLTEYNRLIEFPVMLAARAPHRVLGPTRPPRRL